MLRLPYSRPSGQDDPPAVDNLSPGSCASSQARAARAPSELAPAPGTSPVPAPSMHQEADWKRHREAITRLYWEDNLPLHDVRDIMKRDYEFDASVKMYKKRLREWGVRKNIRSAEAWEVASGQQTSPSLEFWPDSRSSDYKDRIARHLRRCKHGVSTRGRSCPQCRALRPKAEHMQEQASSALVGALAVTAAATTPAYTSKGLASVEMGLYYADIFFKVATDAQRSKWCSAPDTPKHVQFAVLFDQSLEKLVLRNNNNNNNNASSRQVEPPKVRLQEQQLPMEAFADIDRAFDLLRDLIGEDHPHAYHTLVNSMALCKTYPASELCFRVCRMLAKHCQQLSLVVLGTSHPINPLFAADVGLVEHGEASDFGMFLEGTRTMCVKYCIETPTGSSTWPSGPRVEVVSRGSPHESVTGQPARRGV